jgi:DNA polymerase III epsilon subunit family exonuclease
MTDDTLPPPLFAFATLEGPVDPSVANRDYAVIDLETTGRYTPPHRICEVAIVRVRNGRVVDEWATLVNPERPTGPEHVHGIMRRDVRDAPRFADIATDILARLDGATVVAHAAAFDEQFLAYEFMLAGLDVPVFPALCTHELDRSLRPDADNHSLSATCAAHGVPLVDGHSALGDARATAWVLPLLLERARALGRMPQAPVAAPRVPDRPDVAATPLLRRSYATLPPGAAVAGDADVVPAWYRDPSGAFSYRWWNGRTWTEDVAVGGERIVPLDARLTGKPMLPRAHGADLGR